MKTYGVGDPPTARVAEHLERVKQLNARYRAGDMRATVPEALHDGMRCEERSLKQLWDLLVSGRLPHADKSRDTYRREMDTLDEFLARPPADTQDAALVDAFVQAERAKLSADVVRRSRRVAAVLVEPIQGEGGVRLRPRDSCAS